MDQTPDLISLLDASGKARPLAQIEREAVTFALRLHEGNITATARALGVTKVTVYALARNYGVDLVKIRSGDQP